MGSGKPRKAPEPVNPYAELDKAPFDIGTFLVPFEKHARMVKVMAYFPERKITSIYVDYANFAKTKRKGVNKMTIEVLYSTEDDRI